MPITNEGHKLILGKLETYLQTQLGEYINKPSNPKMLEEICNRICLPTVVYNVAKDIIIVDFIIEPSPIKYFFPVFHVPDNDFIILE